MSRPKGSKNRNDGNESDSDNIENKMEEKESILVENETVSIFEASEQLGTSESTIKIWVDHGHLTSINGRIPVRSIRECRFNPRRFV